MSLELIKNKYFFIYVKNLCKKEHYVRKKT